MFNIIQQVQAADSGGSTSTGTGLGKIGDGTNLITESGIYDEGKIEWAVLMGTIAQILFFAAAVASFFFLIWGGITFITSSGEAAKKSAARNRIVYAAIGMLITAAAFAIWKLVMTVAGAGGGLNPGF